MPPIKALPAHPGHCELLSTQQLAAHNSFTLVASKAQRGFSHVSCFWNLENLIAYCWRLLHLSLMEQEEEPPGRDEDLTVLLTTKPWRRKSERGRHRQA